MKVMSTQPEISDSGTLVFLRSGKNADLAEIHAGLSMQDGVTASVPVFGDWSMLLRLAAKDRESLKRLIDERIRPIKGVDDIRTYYREETWTAAGAGADQKSSACAVLDVDSGSVAALVSRFRAMAGIIEGNVTDGGKNIVLFMRGNSSREIRNVLGGEIRPLPGVLRIKLFNIMN
jgi:DNA-binding Lrp family transcriptional regulator